MITFSFRPIRRSRLPSRAASVSTLVVSWKEAADRKDSVASEALVIPRITVLGLRRGLGLLALELLVDRVEDEAVLELAGQELGRALGLDPHLLQHLADDQLDVLVVDVDALGAVDLLHLGDDVDLGLGPAVDREQLGRVERALVQLVARLDPLAVLDVQVGPGRERVVVLLALVVGDRHLDGLVGLLDRDLAVDLGDLRQALRLARLEQLDDAGQALGDVQAGDAAGVEGAHRQLGARLADRLGGDDPDRVADLDQRRRSRA